MSKSNHTKGYNRVNKNTQYRKIKLQKKFGENGICHICGSEYTHFGNNPEPLYAYEQRVCDQCNREHILPARLRRGPLSRTGAETVERVDDILNYYEDTVQGRDPRARDQYQVPISESSHPEEWLHGKLSNWDRDDATHYPDNWLQDVISKPGYTNRHLIGNEAILSNARLALSFLGEALTDKNMKWTAEFITQYNMPPMQGLSDEQRRKWAKQLKKFLYHKNVPWTENYADSLNAVDGSTMDWVQMSRAMKSGFNLEKPQGTSLHHLLDWLTEQTEETEVLRGWVDLDFKSFVVEHDWAKAFEGVKDFEGGEIKLPFPYTCFEFRVSGIRVLLLLGYREGNIEGVVVLGKHKHWYVDKTALKMIQGQYVPGRNPADEWAIDKWRVKLVEQVRAVCIMLDAGVAVPERRSHGGPGLNKQRANQGKAPLKDYHIVVLSKRHRSTHDHDSEPTGIKRRLHWRRGHYRHFNSPGGQEMYIDHDGITRSRTWINWMLVGDERLGFVDKHYRL